MPKIETVTEADLTALAARAFQNAGLSAEGAKVTARHLVLMDLMGVSTHGVHRAEQYIKRLKAGVVVADAKVTVTDRGPSLAIVDGGNGQGQVVATKALEVALVKAHNTGISFVAVRRSGHFGGNASYGLMAAETGMILLSGTGASPSMTPFGGRDLKVGNNPFGFAAPRGDGPPFILDMAQSIAARGKMRKLRDAGEPMPAGWALDKDGNPTTDPQAGLDGFIQFIGGHKGYGLALMVDILSGLLSGGQYLNDTREMWDEDAPQGTAHFFLALDPYRLLDQGEYDRRMADFCGRIKTTAPFKPGGEVLLPGELEMRSLEKRRRDGIPVPKKTMDEVRALAS